MAPKSSKPQAHGLTHGDMKELQEAQINGEQFSEEINGSVDAEYKLPAHESNFVHARLQNPGFDQNTGKALDNGRVQKYTPMEFKNHEANNGFAGLKVTILHNPKAKAGAPDNKPQSGVQASPHANDIPLDKLNKGQLQAKYKELYAEDAPPNSTKPELIKFIDEKVLFLQEEAKAAQNNGTGADNQNNGEQGENDQHEQLV